MSVLTTEDLSKEFDGEKAVRDLNLSLDDEEIFGLAGPDGAGKTTTVRLLAGILEPSSGGASVLGMDLVEDRESIKQEVSYLPERFSLYGDLSVMENLQFYGDLYEVDREVMEDRIRELLRITKLEDFTDRRADALSGGMKQKLVISCGLLTQPPFLIVDEPTRGVDPVSRQDIWQLFNRSVGEGISILVATSSLAEAERCDRVGFLLNGELLRVNRPETMEEQFQQSILSMEFERPHEVLDHLRESVSDTQFYLFGERVHAVTPQPEQTEREIRSSFEEMNVNPKNLTQVSPNLEDIFMSLLFEKTNEESKPNAS